VGKILNTEIEYRPKTLDEFLFPNDNVREVVMTYASGKQPRPLILYGLPGSGKSLLAELIPMAIENQDAPQINSIMAHSLNSAKEVCDLFQSGKFFSPLFYGQKYNYFVIEEVNKLARGSDSLRVMMDKYLGIDLTILTSNELDKVDSAVKSRCERLHVQACEPKVFLPRALEIVHGEGYDIDPNELLLMLEAVYSLGPDNRAYYQKIDEILRKVPA